MSNQLITSRKTLQGLPTGHAVALTLVLQGLQLMSVLTGCESGAC